MKDSRRDCLCQATSQAATLVSRGVADGKILAAAQLDSGDRAAVCRPDFLAREAALLAIHQARSCKACCGDGLIQVCAFFDSRQAGSRSRLYARSVRIARIRPAPVYFAY